MSVTDLANCGVSDLIILDQAPSFHLIFPFIHAGPYSFLFILPFIAEHDCAAQIGFVGPGAWTRGVTGRAPIWNI